MQDPTGPLDILATNDMFTDPSIDLEEPARTTDAVPSGDGGDEPEVEEHDESDDAPAPLLSVAAMLGEYRRTRDRSVLRTKPNEPATEFHITRMNSAYILSVLKQLPEGQRLVLAVCAACHRVKLPNGRFLKPQSIGPARSYGVRLADEKEWIETLAKRFGTATVEEIGRVAIALASLPEGAKGPFG